MSDTAERVKNIVVEHLGVDAEQLRPGPEAEAVDGLPGVLADDAGELGGAADLDDLGQRAEAGDADVCLRPVAQAAPGADAAGAAGVFVLPASVLFDGGCVVHAHDRTR